MSCDVNKFERMHSLAKTYDFTWTFNVYERLYIVRKQGVLPERVQAEIRSITNNNCRIEYYV